MPGIIVIKQRNGTLFNRNREIIHEMTEVIMHESFYKSQFLEIPELGLHACKVYLDHESSPEEISQNEDGTIYCLLSGELFGTNEIKAMVNKSGHNFKNIDDIGELVIHFYEEKGIDIFKHLNGWFNLLIVDIKNKKILVSNDRFGLDRFYYCNLPDGSILFAPEVKCFKHIPEVNLSLDEKSIIQNFKYNCLLGNNSYYKEIKKFPIATVFIHENNSWKMDEYWTPDEVLKKPKLSIDDYIEQGTDVFESIIEDYYTPHSTGFSLTGGYDTRSILSVLDKKHINLPCYTFGGMYKESFDVKFANRLANLTGNSYHKIILGEDFLNNIDKWFQKAVYISDGIAKLSFCHEYYVNLAAKEFGTIRLTGKYGSQVVRGVSLLKDRSPVPEIFSDEYRGKFNNNGNELTELKKWGLLTSLREELPQLEATKQAQEDAALTVRTPYMDNRFIDILLRAPIMEDKSLLQENIIHKNAPHFAQIPTNHRAHLPRTISGFIKTGPIKNSIRYFHSSMSLFDSVYNWEYLPNWGLLPFKISEISRFSRVFNGSETWVHYRLWSKKNIKDYIKNIILDPITLQRPWYDGQFFEQMIKHHFNSRKNYFSEINKIISFETWCRQNKV